MIGIIIAIVLRGIFIWLGAAAIENFSWVFYIFGAFLIYTAVKLVREGETDDDEYEENRFMRFMESRFPATQEYHGTKLFTRGERQAPGHPAVLRHPGPRHHRPALRPRLDPGDLRPHPEPYIVLVANLFALMGLRQLYFLLGGLLKKLVYLSIGLAVLLAFIGVKLLLHALHENELPFINGGETCPCPRSRSGCRSAPSSSSSGPRPWLSLRKTRKDARDAALGGLSGFRLASRGLGRVPPRPEPEHERGRRDDERHPGQLRDREHLSEDDEPGEGGGGGLEAEQDPEHLRRAAAARAARASRAAPRTARRCRGP